MVKLRLSRFGKKKQPVYRIVAMNARSKRNGEVLEYLGTYNPQTTPSTIEFDKERVQYWLDEGAQPTYTVKSLFVISGFMKSDIKKRPATKKPKESKKETEKTEEVKLEEKPEEVAEVVEEKTEKTNKA